jgi:hypothetical protein
MPKNVLVSPASENPTTNVNQNPTKLKNAVAEKFKKPKATTEKGSMKSTSLLVLLKRK